MKIDIKIDPKDGDSRFALMPNSPGQTYNSNRSGSANAILRENRVIRFYDTSGTKEIMTATVSFDKAGNVAGMTLNLP